MGGKKRPAGKFGCQVGTRNSRQESFTGRSLYGGRHRPSGIRGKCAGQESPGGRTATNPRGDFSFGRKTNRGTKQDTRATGEGGRSRARIGNHCKCLCHDNNVILVSVTILIMIFLVILIAFYLMLASC
mmetsp:Transcript_5180/g.11491  ORF Transcript_5180/g.11491 Transcript_5180/m.11491 type:complete len:129 (+) Transcript_5180:595-981(+)